MWFLTIKKIVIDLMIEWLLSISWLDMAPILQRCGKYPHHLITSLEVWSASAGAK